MYALFRIHVPLFLSLPREVWPEESSFGSVGIEPEQELTLLQDIFKANLGQSAGKWR